MRSRGDPSLRLKNGYAQDDAIYERTMPSEFKLRHYPLRADFGPGVCSNLDCEEAFIYGPYRCFERDPDRKPERRIRALRARDGIFQARRLRPSAGGVFDLA